ncbi:MAG: B12-binding domain-containing radical SAM protein [Candidatus Hydrogenedentes bacterium]|nr:B12-binding domain-containing radical SAM protein [Candidatus Hydrogenedentota bacterium]
MMRSICTASSHIRPQLVLAPPDQNSGRISRSGCFPPLGLLGIATWLRERTGIAAEILDGEILDLQTLAARLRDGLVGISVSQLTYANSVALAQIAKGRGATVVFGGHHATAHAERILRTQPSVDAVVVGDGEEAFAGLATGAPYEKAPNLVYRDAEGIIRYTERRDVDLRAVPIPDRTLVPLEPYIANFCRQNPNKPFRRPFAVWTQKGCAWRARSGGCSFCARTDHGWRARDVATVWREIGMLCRTYGADYIWELSDDILSDTAWFNAFAESKPPEVNPAFMFYARPAHVTSQAAASMARLGAYEVFLGIEAGDDTILRMANRGITTATNLLAVKRLSEHGLKVFPSFVLGLEGESKVTLRRTEEHLLRILDMASVDTIAVCHFMPLPGAPAYDRLMRVPKVRAKYAHMDHVPLAALQEEWLRRFCHVTVEELTATRERMISYAPVASGMGVPAHATNIGPSMTLRTKVQPQYT